MREFRALVLALAFGLGRGNVAYWRPSNHQGLYIKPSNDGITGDLFVAATEDFGVQSPWLADPLHEHVSAPAVSFLSSLTAASLPHGESTVANQKRAVVQSPAIKYTYAIPVPGASEGSAVPYPYALPATPAATADTAPTVTAEESTKECPKNPCSPQTYQYPYQYYYPHMMAALANVVSSALKEGGVSEETEGSTAQTAQTAYAWPYSYPYPVQYVVMDPSAWRQTKTTEAPPTTTEPSTASSSDESEN